jgi:hypothetical protein
MQSKSSFFAALSIVARSVIGLRRMKDFGADADLMAFADHSDHLEFPAQTSFESLGRRLRGDLDGNNRSGQAVAQLTR